MIAKDGDDLMACLQVKYDSGYQKAHSNLPREEIVGVGFFISGRVFKARSWTAVFVNDVFREVKHVWKIYVLHVELLCRNQPQAHLRCATVKNNISFL